jgi:predicted CXXCH cytochrome family protein
MLRILYSKGNEAISMNFRALFGFVILAGVTVFVIPAAADDEKEAAANGGSQACISCHDSAANQARQYDMRRTSAHSKALSLVIQNTQASSDCYSCHSEEGFKAKLQGTKVDMALKENFHTVTCSTCHNIPHNGKYPHQLVTNSEDLCSSCHTQRAVLQGRGAKGIDETRSFHSDVECISCHMSEGNHLMKLIRPDDPELSEKRQDTCTACHKDNNRAARARQLNEWQSTYKEQMDPLQADLKAVSAALKERPGLLNDTMKGKLNDLRTNLSILTRDKSRAAHNIDFALEIMSSAAKNLAEIKAALK